MSLLSIDALTLAIRGTPVLRGVSLAVEPGRTLGLVGESGSGKSLTALAAMGLLPEGAATTGTIGHRSNSIIPSKETLCACSQPCF